MKRRKQPGAAPPLPSGGVPPPVPRSEALEAELGALEAMLPPAPAPAKPAPGTYPDGTRNRPSSHER